ncbi:hypothetical protein EMIHUDRAFT_107666 [Emiliania huxleyi CCMP1516]|uniref:Uncharacterized protein n=2 Tax=Emiliania huxleyi TaxID=2903 RepID=A0A0D3HZR5_EMIH1|nr:hypothetical protein EMIHUDRAFT_107666 [Emiliania huxleyi CCMP1516]EOD04500.1 hypothetical protein EMIHUDRAFT_107666 [Emiliania huxleyi CCMP1516]|eukprot:XP_005756929.1 hypothetical protein EMIHUDRAFT_107666 [Emiliania huxleyi CCMP1516]
MSYVSDWMAPGKLVASLGAPFWGNLKPTAGDFACLCSLFFDNLSTMLTFSAIWQAPPFTAHESLPPPIPTLHAISLSPALNRHPHADSATRLFDVTDGGDKARELLYKRIIPGCGFVLFLGNVYYSWMATRMKTQFGREFTSQPYGISDIMSLVSAYNAGGTCIYFGHPVHKKIGGKYFFSFANGVIYLVITLAGIFPFILDITPAVASGPTIMIFGLMLCEESNLLLGMLWAAILVYAIDRKYVAAAFASLVAFVFALLGIIHQPEIKFVDGAFMDGYQTVLGGDGYHSGGNSLWPSQKNDPRYSTSAFQTSMAYLTKTFPDKYPQKLLADSDEAVAEDEQAMNSKLIVIGSFGDWWSKAMAGAPVDVAKEAM